MRVVAFTGMPGSGKSLAVEAARDRDVPVVPMGDLVREEAEAQGADPDEGGIGRVAVEMRDDHGMDVWAVRTLDRLKTLEADVAVVDGVRGLAEVETFRDGLGEDFVLVAVHASPETRFDRTRARDRSDAPGTWEAFKARDERELDFGIGTAIALADVLIVNEQDKAAFLEKVDRCLDRVLDG